MGTRDRLVTVMPCAVERERLAMEGWDFNALDASSFDLDWTCMVLTELVVVVSLLKGSICSGFRLRT